MHRSFVLPAFAAAIGALALPTALLAHEHDDVVVTATRTEQDSSAVLAPVTVLTRADIERLQPTDLSELLAQVPGIDLIRSGGAGAATSLFMRGSNGDHTLFLVDGQRVASATQGTTGFQFIDPEQIERIEIVRGPRSSLYGADAIGGVIQIFTRRGGKTPSAQVRVGYGANHSSELAAGAGGQWQQLRYSAQLSHAFTEGINNTRSHRPPMNDDDAYRNSSGSFNLGYDFQGGASIDLQHFYSRIKNEYDGTGAATQPYAESWIQNTNAALRAPLTTAWTSTWSAGRAFDDTDTFDKLKPASRGDIRTTRDSASWQNDIALGEHQTLSLGIDYYDDRVDSNTVFRSRDGAPVSSRANTGYFTQYLSSWGPLHFQAGVRADDNEEYGGETTGHIAAGFDLPRQHRFTLSYGSAFKAPTFNQLYYPGFGNPDLEPESSENYEMELRGVYRNSNRRSANWSLNLFENRVDNLIQNLRIAPGVTIASNVQQARIRGGELAAGARIDAWSLSGSLAYTDPRDEDTNQVLVRRARRSVKLELDRRSGAWTLGASWRAQNHRYIDAANTTTLGGYGLLDARAGFTASRAWTLQLKLTNVLAKKYQLNDGYETERFGWFASATWRL